MTTRFGQRRSDLLRLWPFVPSAAVLAGLFFIPLAIVFVYSFWQVDPNLQVVPDWTLRNYQRFFTNEAYLRTFGKTLVMAALVTVVGIAIAIPYAWFLVRYTSRRTQRILLLLTIVPFWTSFLIRIYAWIGILKNNGLINNALLSLGLIDEPLAILHTPIAVYIGIVYAYLPFMVLPLYANLVKHDSRLLEAASDLGASAWKAFLTITLPLSRAGIIAGSMLVMIPVVGEFVIPELLGGPDTLMIGRVLWQEFFNNRDWPVASAVAIVLLLLLIVPILIFHRYQSKELEAKLL